MKIYIHFEPATGRAPVRRYNVASVRDNGPRSVVVGMLFGEPLIYDHVVRVAIEIEAQ